MNDYFRFNNSGKKIKNSDLAQKFENKNITNFKSLKPILSVFDKNTIDNQLSDSEITCFGKIMQKYAGLDKVLTLDEFKTFLKDNAIKVENPETIYREFKTYFLGENSGVEATSETSNVDEIEAWDEVFHPDPEKTLVSTSGNTYKYKDATSAATQIISADAARASEIYNYQISSEGGVSRFVNGTKEFFDTEYAGSKVKFAIAKEEFSANILQTASEGTLTIKEYYDKKIEFFENNFPTDTLTFEDSFDWLGIILGPGIVTKATNFNFTNEDGLNMIYSLFCGKGAQLAQILGVNIPKDLKSEDLKAEIIKQLKELAIRALTPSAMDRYINILSSTPPEQYQQKNAEILSEIIANYCSQHIKEYSIGIDIQTETKKVENPAWQEWKNAGSIKGSRYNPETGRTEFITEPPRYILQETVNEVPTCNITQTTKPDHSQSVSALSRTEKLMTFEDCFYQERGVAFNEANVMDYFEKILNSNSSQICITVMKQ